MRRLILIPLLAGLIAIPLAGVSAQEAPAEPEAAPAEPEVKAKSLDDLLRLVREGSLNERRRNQERERRFRESRQEQQRLLNDAKRTLANAEARSERLEKSFNQNEQSLASLEQQLRERLGALGELFGIVRAVSGDTLGAVPRPVQGAPGDRQAPAPLADPSGRGHGDRQDRELPGHGDHHRG